MEQIANAVDELALKIFRTYSEERLNNLRNQFRNDKIQAMLNKNLELAYGSLALQRVAEQVMNERRSK